MSKCGSSTIKYSLMKHYDVHHHHSAEGMPLFDFAKCYVISLVRELVGRNISHFFEDMSKPGYDWYVGSREFVRSLSIDDLLHWFYVKMPMETHLKAGRWFEEQFRPLLNLDVFATEFDKDKGYQLYNKKCLLLRMEDINRSAADALRALFNRRLEVKHYNVARDKEYWDVYKEFCAIPVDRNYIDAIYDCHCMRHFYSPVEIEGYARDWAKGISPNSKNLIDLKTEVAYVE